MCVDTMLLELVDNGLLRPEKINVTVPDGHTLEEQLQQTTILLQDIPSAPRPKRALVDKGYRGVTIPGVEILHPGKMRSMTPVP